MRIPSITSKLTPRERHSIKDFVQRQEDRAEGYMRAWEANSVLYRDTPPYTRATRHFAFACRLAEVGRYIRVPGLRDAQIQWRRMRVSRAADRLGALADRAEALNPQS